MPCAFTSSIMSTEYAHEGNQHGSNMSTTSGDEMGDEQKRSDSLPPSPTTSYRTSSPSKNDFAKDRLLEPTTRPPHHSFSIDALVGNTKSAEPSKTTVNSDLTVDSWNSTHLIDLKRIQTYYQQLYSHTFPLKQLNHYLFPHLGTVDTGAKLEEHSRQHDQLLAYYANLYFHNSSLYQQERYLDSFKTFPTTEKSAVESNSRNFTEYTQKKDKCDRTTKEEGVERCSTESEKHSSSQVIPNDSFLGLQGHAQTDTFFNGLSGPNPTIHTGSSSPSTQTSIYSPLDKSVDHSATAQSPLSRPGFSQQQLFTSQSVTTPINGSSFYPPYCDYDLLVKSKSNLLLTGGSPGGTPTNPVHSPLASGTSAGDHSNGPSPVSTASTAAAAAAYHLSSMFRKPKRIRTAFSPGQLLRLEEIFEKNRYVVGCERKQLARDLNLSETQIKVWFQNRRTKHKREKHIGVSGQTMSSGGMSYQLEEQPKKSSSVRGLSSGSSGSSSSASSLPSSSSMSGSSYLSTGTFQTMSSSSLYSSHFKAQSNAHRTLLAK